LKHREHAGLWGSKPSPFSTAAVFVFAFVCFLPNPALPIGASTGLQAGQIVTLLYLPVALILGLPRRQTLALLLLTLPVLLSLFLVVLTDRAVSNEVALKAVLALALAAVILLPTGNAVNRRYAWPLVSGVAWAIALNAVVGFYQAYRFTQDEAPLVGLYQNPSFDNFMGNSPEQYALYIKRPFGLFSEPSAMAASIGPWLILIAGVLLYPKLRQGMTRGALTQLSLAVVCGVGLIILSRSGFTVYLLAGLVLVALPHLRHHALRLYRPGSLFALTTLILVGAALALLSFAFVGSRLDVQENSSWSARLGSIVWSLSYLGTSLSNLLFGVGAGQSYLILQSSGPSSLPAASSGGLAVDAVWSVATNYALETGLVGILAIALVFVMIVQAILRSSARLVGFSCLGAWLAGVVFTTSYGALLPIWLFLGVLLGWDRVFHLRATASVVGPQSALLPVRKAVRT
jgi:hypothetical protein